MRLLVPLLPFVLLLATLFVPLGATHADETVPSAQSLVHAPTREAIERGTRYLMDLQLPSGAWPSDAGKKVNEAYLLFEPSSDHRAVPHVGVTALATLSLLAGGHLPGRGTYGAAMERGIDWMLSQVQSNGLISAHATRMYSHALATLALAEIYGVSQKARVRTKLQDAIEFTIKSQNRTGGWRYVPFTSDSDMSVTVCQIVALRAARNVGIRVPSATIERALDYVIGSAVVRRGEPTGAFWYQPEDQQRFNRDSFALCAAALTSLFQAGIYDDEGMRRHAERRGLDPGNVPSIRRSVEFMRTQYTTVTRDFPNHYFFYYGNYYACQALYQVGGTNPRLWADWYRRVRDDLLKRQRPHTPNRGGAPQTYWVSNVDRTHAYATATALLILQFPLDHLPIHQR